MLPFPCRGSGFSAGCCRSHICKDDWIQRLGGPDLPSRTQVSIQPFESGSILAPSVRQNWGQGRWRHLNTTTWYGSPWSSQWRLCWIATSEPLHAAYAEDRLFYIFLIRSWGCVKLSCPIHPVTRVMQHATSKAKLTLRLQGSG